MKLIKLVTELTRKLRKDQENTAVRLKLAALYRELDRRDEAVELYRSVALDYQKLGRIHQAIAVCRSALDIEPNDAAVRALLAELERMREAEPAPTPAPSRSATSSPISTGDSAPERAPRQGASGPRTAAPRAASPASTAEEPRPPEGVPRALSEAAGIPSQSGRIDLPSGQVVTDADQAQRPRRRVSASLYTPTPLPEPLPLHEAEGEEDSIERQPIRLRFAPTGPLPLVTLPSDLEPLDDELFGDEPALDEAADALSASAPGQAGDRNALRSDDDQEDPDLLTRLAASNHGVPVLPSLDPDDPDHDDDVEQTGVTDATAARREAAGRLDSPASGVPILRDALEDAETGVAEVPLRGRGERRNEYLGEPADTAVVAVVDGPARDEESSWHRDSLLDVGYRDTMPASSQRMGDAMVSLKAARVQASGVPELLSDGAPEPLLDEDKTIRQAVPVPLLGSPADSGPNKVAAPRQVRIHTLSLFSVLPQAAVIYLVERMAQRSYKDSEYVFLEGDPADSWFLVDAGEICILRRHALLAPGEPRVEIARLGAGALFGELGLLEDHRRYATAQAMGPCRIYEIPRRLLRELAATHAEVGPLLESFYRQRLLSQLLETAPFLRTAEAAQRDEIMARFQPMHCGPGESILPRPDADAPAGGLYLVVQGSVEITRHQPGQPATVLATLDEGAFFGDISFLAGPRARVTATAASADVELAVLAAEDFRTLVVASPESAAWDLILRDSGRPGLADCALLTGETPMV